VHAAHAVSPPAVYHNIALQTDGGPSRLVVGDRKLFVGCFHGSVIQVFNNSFVAKIPLLSTE